MDPQGGRRLQIRDLEKVKALEKRMKRPAMLTLTIDRKRFAGPEAAYDYAMRRVSRLLTERLGAKTWLRVIEVQTKTGDGWIHWHVLIDLGEVGPMGDVAGRVWALWRDKWRIGGCDLQPIKRSAAGYLASYISKKWTAVPRWMGESRKRFRILGTSTRAGEIIRAALGLPDRIVRMRTPARRRMRKTRRLFDRLAGSGLQMAVIYRGADDVCQYFGTIGAGFNEILCAMQRVAVPWLRCESEVYESKSSCSKRLSLQVATECTREQLTTRVSLIQEALRRCGAFDASLDRYHRARDSWRRSWIESRSIAGT